MKFENFSSLQKILLYGYGREGQSSEKFLKSKFPHIALTIFEDREGISKPDFSSFDLILVSPGIPRKKITGVLPSKITSQTELFFDNLTESQRKKIIGIGGTKGKSTTTKFCAEVLQNAGMKVAIGGNFGRPLLELWDDFQGNKIEYIVAELSSYQLEYLTISPGIAIFLNFFPDHLDRHGTVESYFEAKKNLWSHQHSGDIFIVPESSRPLFLGKEKHTPLFSKKIEAELFPKGSVFRADHWRDNFGAVSLLLSQLKLQPVALQSTTGAFQGLPHRMQYFATKKGILFYDDTISTNPDSTLATLKFFGENLGSVILGGQDRKQNFAKLMSYLHPLETHLIFLDSEISSRLVESASSEGIPKNRISLAKDLREAVQIAFAHTPKKTSCVLSPTAPSYDRFKNFEEKGNEFQREVETFHKEKVIRKKV